MTSPIRRNPTPNPKPNRNIILDDMTDVELTPEGKAKLEKWFEAPIPTAAPIPKSPSGDGSGSEAA